MSAVSQQSFDNAAVTILCVEDEANILTALRRMFWPLGYQILTASGGAEGMRILEEKTIDLVISDMRMPEMDGAEFLGMVAALWPWVIRVLLSGHSDISATVDAINKGKIYRYISNPWEEADLKLTVQGALEQRFLEQARRRLEKLTYVQNEELQELNARLEDKVAQRTQELATANEALHANHMLTIKGFSNMIEAREPLLAGHSQRVADMSMRLASKLAMNAPQEQELCHAALLHDIGKICLPDHLLTMAGGGGGGGGRGRGRAHAVN